MGAKLELLTEKGYIPKSEQRLRVYLTNSLEEHHKDTGTLFANWLSSEANEANHIKRDTPVMCVIGNPPYSGISSNKGKWISDLLEDYKYVDGVHFNERKHWLNDDYVKFIRYGQHYIEKNGSGVLAYINPHGYLDNPTFRGMRWNLLKTYDKIYTIDLHGNALKRETTPDGGKDENVFDIMQGVSINIFVKTGEKKPNELGEVFHYDLYGRRQNKYDFLNKNSLKQIPFVNVKSIAPYYFFIPKNETGRKEYEKGFSVEKFFSTNVTGVVTARDSVVIDFEEKTLLQKMEKFTSEDFTDQEIRDWLFPNKKQGKYLKGDTRGWKLSEARRSVVNNNHLDYICEYNYRPFDFRKIYYTPQMVDWGREDVMSNFIYGENVGLIFARQTTTEDWSAIQISNSMIDNRYHFSYKGIPQQAPLYIYQENNNQQSTQQLPKRIPNLNKEILVKIEKDLGLEFFPEEPQEGEVSFVQSNQLRDDFKIYFTPLNLLDYIYAVLHSPTYKEKYKEFLKIDFPRVPYPKDKEVFWQLVKLGGELREVHLLKYYKVGDYITQYPIGGNNIITRRLTKRSIGFELLDDTKGRVWINDEQYFENVPLIAWEFYIGGYQPAQKWLKDRRDRELSFDDILHYQKIIVALTETDRLMKEIDKVEFMDEVKQ